MDAQTWFDNLPVGDDELSLLSFGVGQPALVYDLTAGYSRDNVSASLDIYAFCGAPSYNITVQDEQGQPIPYQKMVQITQLQQTGQ